MLHSLLDPPITFAQLPDSSAGNVTVIGRKEALQAIRILCAHYNTHFIDVSDEVGFPWRRWLCNLVFSREIMGAGIVQVLAVSTCGIDDEITMEWPWPYSDFLALRRQDRSMCIVNPKTQKYSMSDPHQFIQFFNSDVERFENVVVATRSWTTLRTMIFNADNAEPTAFAEQQNAESIVAVTMNACNM